MAAMESVRCGMIGMRNTVTLNPASVAARTVSSRAVAFGVPGSMRCWSSSSNTAIDIARVTCTLVAASVSRGRSRRNSVPLVRIENGVPDSVSADTMPGISL